jgi:hypothetical protein
MTKARLTKTTGAITNAVAMLDAFDQKGNAAGVRHCGFGIPRKIPAGRVIVHNHVRPMVPPNDPFPKKDWYRDAIGIGLHPGNGMMGFRVWTQIKTKELRLCDCGYPSLEHYCVKAACGTRSRKGVMYKKARGARR